VHTPRRAGVAVASLLVALTVACGDDTSDGATDTVPPPGGTAPPATDEAGDQPSDLPPADPLELVDRYGEAFAAHGLEITARGGLIDRHDGYTGSAEGTHLALYAAPVGARTPEEHLDALMSLTAAVAPDAFERFPGLESFDICQEIEDPEGGWGDRTPHIATQVDLTREQSDALDWDTATLADLLVTIRELPEGAVRVDDRMATLAGWTAAVDEAEARNSTG
jgi:hypothetical protein